VHPATGISQTVQGYLDGRLSHSNEEEVERVSNAA